MIIKKRIRFRTKKEIKLLKENRLKARNAEKEKNLKEKPKVYNNKKKKSVKKLDKIDFVKIKKESRVKKISIIFFIWCALLYLIGLQYKFSDYYNIILFWVPILLMISIILYQIFFLTNNNFVLLEIFLVYLLLHLIYVVGYYGLRGSDSYIDYNFLKDIINNHNFRLEVSFQESIRGYPMLHIFSSTTSIISKINPLLVAKYLPSLLSSLIVFPIYLFGYSVYNDKKIALFSCLIFGTIPQFMSFETAFIREVIALFFMILFFYLIHIFTKRNSYFFYLFIFILIPAVIFSHHLTSFLVLALLIIYLMLSKVFPFILKLINYIFHIKITFMKGLAESLNRRVLLVVIIFSTSLSIYLYLLYELEFFTGFFSDIINEILGVRNVGGTYAETSNLGDPIVTLKGNIIFYGFFFFNILFGLIFIIKFFIKNINLSKIEVTCMIYYFFCMFLGFLTMFVVSHMAFPDRFIPFGFMFGLIPLAGMLLFLKKNIFKKIIAILLISFIVYNLYYIDTNYYTNNATFTGGATSEKEYLIANHIIFPDDYYGPIAAFDAVYDIQGINPKLGVRDPLSIKDFRNSSTMAILNEEMYLQYIENLQKKSIEEYSKNIEILSYKNNKYIDKICDLGNIYVIKGGT